MDDVDFFKLLWLNNYIGMVGMKINIDFTVC
jgi:hypothetical protein